MRTQRTVAEVFAAPAGPVHLPDSGCWWINRDKLGQEGEDDVLTIDVADGRHNVKLSGSAKALRNVAESIVGQVDSWVFNGKTLK